MQRTGQASLKTDIVITSCVQFNITASKQSIGLSNSRIWYYQYKDSSEDFPVLRMSRSEHIEKKNFFMLKETKFFYTQGYYPQDSLTINLLNIVTVCQRSAKLDEEDEYGKIGVSYVYCIINAQVTLHAKSLMLME